MEIPSGWGQLTMVTFVQAYTFVVDTRSGAPAGAAGVFDFNGDGYDDLVVGPLNWPPTEELLPTIVVRNNGNGTFSDVTDSIAGGIPTVVHPREIITVDFNGDGLEDVFIADHGYDSEPFPGMLNRLLLTENGGLSFSEARLPNFPDFTHSTSTADVDGDGDLDIMVGNMAGDEVYGPYILANDGAGNFSIAAGALPSSAYASPNEFYSHLELGDINGDGAPDLFLGSALGYHRILWNDGTGKFADTGTSLPAAFGGDSQAIDIDFFDVNGDGRTDILVNSYRYDFTGVGTQMLVQQADGSFIDEALLRFGVDNEEAPYFRLWNELVDFDGDGDLDIFATYNGSDAPRPELWINDGGQFARTSLDFATSNLGFVGDFDGNGTPDFGTIEGGGFTTIFLNQTPPDASQTGTAANDSISVRTSTLTVDGLGGVDTATFDAARSAFAISKNGSGSIGLTGDAYTVTLSSVERLGFSDGTLAFDLDGIAGQAYRIYQAAFDRTPDTAGLSYWIKSMDAGTALIDVASGFVSSAEFADVYGADASNETFVSTLYENVLGRDGEAAGIEFWVGQLQGGVTRAQVLAGFSESPENVTGVAPAIADGIWYA
ncbi:FG-GAP-like repeat-containing protein [Mesorhizobium sp. CAU 1741]|uniref:FG-GAP-like repeat-containing protein n=1 Tax=Mesorhizobium sp. CAU 1741 TaxID=3140366 RepID=UPI00325A527F